MTGHSIGQDFQTLTAWRFINLFDQNGQTL
jgi:hypothetical protein